MNLLPEIYSQLRRNYYPVFVCCKYTFLLQNSGQTRINITSHVIKLPRRARVCPREPKKTLNPTSIGFYVGDIRVFLKLLFLYIISFFVYIKKKMSISSCGVY